MRQACLTILFLCLSAGLTSASIDCANPDAELDLSLPDTSADAAPAALTPEDLPPCATMQLEQGRDRMRDRGAVCGDWTILGETRKALKSKARGCGISNPVSVYRISDVALSQFSLMDCQTAVTLKTWIENTAKPAFADMGGGLKGMRVVGHYACKTQNNQPRARLSQHARGSAIDISTFVLQDGTQITVQDGWKDEAQSAVLRKLHSGACGVFSTVLGPDADRYHVGHFHFDTAQRKGAPVCR
ncbi:MULTISPECIES: extensin family protein [unclassified Ruegeria]|uniref:extensin-like domain-containing protein n=1 Tax=unclassified Ruegeria TaxID=2625375 RepID=UPI001491CA06|nr:MULTISPECIES: extensin family protein [unclassified Ruegeria]NOD34113.1 hypothetical protein [Ruegeria sp. HKCCD7296]NOE41137.1 hypothetical protein [Ruegeria sp. HKCCD7319]